MGYEMRFAGGPAEGDDPEEYARRSRFSATDSMMASLRHEMERQGMTSSEPGDDRIPAIKLLRYSELVTPDQVRAALLRSSSDPAPPHHEVSIDQWREQWEAWLDFLVGAAQPQHGGFIVERVTLFR
jgi:hypothetical protein